MVKIVLGAAALVLISATACSSDSSDTPGATPAAASQTYLVTDCGNPGEPGDGGFGVGGGPSRLTFRYSMRTCRWCTWLRGPAPVSELITAELRAGSGDAAALDDLITVEYCGVGLSTGGLVRCVPGRAGQPLPSHCLKVS